MSTIHLLTDDIDTTHTQSILGDGVQFLYFINTVCRSDYFLEKLKLVVPKNTPPEKLLQVIKFYCRGVYRHVYLTAGVRRILREMTSGSLSTIPLAKVAY